MGVYIKNWSLADWKELLKWAKIGANNAMIGEFAEVEEIPPHGRLIDADGLEQECQKRLLICTDQFQRPYEVMRAIALAPTIIEAEERE